MANLQCKYIIAFYDANFEPRLSTTLICVEYMDKGSFEEIYKKIGPVQVEALGKVSVAVIEAISYLYDDLGIIPRSECYIFLAGHRNSIVAISIFLELGVLVHRYRSR